MPPIRVIADAGAAGGAPAAVLRHRAAVRARRGLPLWLSRWLLATSLLGLLVAVPLFLLAAAELAEPEDDWAGPFMHRVELKIREHEKLHYGIHLTLGRALAVCPCTRRWSASQYYKASFHAHTPRQTALVTTERPNLTSVRSILRDTVRLAGGGVKWAGDHLLARAERPPS